MPARAAASGPPFSGFPGEPTSRCGSRCPRSRAGSSSCRRRSRRARRRPRPRPRERDAVERLHRAVARRHVLELEERGPRLLAAPSSSGISTSPGRLLRLALDVLAAEVRLDHGRVGLYLRRCPVRDLAPEAEDVHVVGDRMTRFMWCSTRSTVSSKSSRSFWMNVPSSPTSSWLTRRPARRAGADAASPRARARARPASGSRTEAPRRGSARGPRARRPRAPRRRSFSPAFAEPVRADEHVLEHGHRPEELDVLERARDALADDPCGRRFRIDEPSSSTSPGVRLVEPRDDVERGRLPRAVRPDQAGDVPSCRRRTRPRRARRCLRSAA